MRADLWKKVEELFYAVQAQPPDQRAEFLNKACPDDPQVRAEVQSLLDAAPGAVSFLDSSPLASALSPGAKLGHFEILGMLGRGGMGEVYRARDSRLKREVAIKVLPVNFACDPDRLARFEREARAASALNHPNIVSVYDIGQENSTYWIVSELVDGETLRRTIDRGPRPASKAIEIAVQIAEGLAAAHAAGIVHRDLKPGNIMLARAGRVKILDFGLAKREHPAADSSTRELTNEGTVLGTAGYMSPEQVRGEDVDYRSDIFSFGLILYEMLAGKQAFRGSSSIEVMNAILKDDPPELPSSVPPGLERIVRRCLDKEPGRRFQSAADLGFALTSVSMAQPASPTARKNVAWLMCGIVVLSAAGLWLRFLRPASSPELAPRTVPLASYPGNQCCPSFSPDGNQVAFVWNGPMQDNDDIYVKLIGTEHTARLTKDPARDGSPAWSPDGRYIAFKRVLPGDKLGVFLVSAIGGPERKLMETDLSVGLAWHPEGKWLAVPDGDNVWLCSIDTGEKRKLTFPPSDRNDDSPAFSSDGRRLVFSRNSVTGVSEIYLVALSQNLAPQGEAKQLTFKQQWSKGPVWVPNGQEIIFSSGLGSFPTSANGMSYDSHYLSSGAELWRMPVSGSGAPQPRVTAIQGTTPAISRQGNRLAYTRSLVDTNIWQLKVTGSNGKAGEPISLISSTYDENSAQFSPDGKRIVFCSTRSGANEIWVCGRDGSEAVQLTSLGGTMAGCPRWSPDGQRIVFDSNSEGRYQLYQIDAGGGRPQRLTNGPAVDAVASYSRDGRWVYFVSDRSGSAEIWKVPATGGQAVQVTRKGGYVAFESPDGAFVYYAKEPFTSTLWRIPVGGGDEVQILKSVIGLGFALANKGIYFEQPSSNGSSSIQFLSFATNKAVVLATIARPLSSGLSVSPDEKYLLYTQFDRTGSDLMLVENFH